MTKFIFALIIFLLFIWRIRQGFRNGIMKEIVTILSGVISLVSVALVFFAISSYREKALSMFALCVIGLAVLGAVFKLCSLILRPILALSNISVIGALDSILGAVMGAMEAAAISFLVYYVLDHMGIYIINLEVKM